MTDPVLEHYREEAEIHRLEPTSTMADLVTRRKEVEAISISIERLVGSRPADLLDIGCGNGYLLDRLAGEFPALALTGVDFSADMVELARSRRLANCTVIQGDVRHLDALDHASFDLVVSERCVINVLDRHQQAQAIGELRRVLRPGGHLLFLEAFLDGLANLNRAREELGLPPNEVPFHNLWFDPQWFDEVIEGRFARLDQPASGLAPQNFLSTHYFWSRVVYPAITKAEIRYNTAFVGFFADEPPRGNFAAIQLHVLRAV